jgi:hypothetical protein
MAHLRVLITNCAEDAKVPGNYPGDPILLLCFDLNRLLISRPSNINGATVGETAAPNKRRQLRGRLGTGAAGSTS